ncbi:MAG: hypothetical protein JWO19_500 [Bryobacterales bacterium]|jgi:hypothetical protein|nr:hypothetical protein [Bryobacterales bacterium]
MTLAFRILVAALRCLGLALFMLMSTDMSFTHDDAAAYLYYCALKGVNHAELAHWLVAQD